jgi:small redox-active disulfide protein 2
MKIEILGTGCAKCNDLYNRVKKVVEETQLTATVTKVEDIMEIMKYGLKAIPAIVIDGTIITQGALPKDSEIKEMLSGVGKTDFKELVKQRYNELAMMDKESALNLLRKCLSKQEPTPPKEVLPISNFWKATSKICLCPIKLQMSL